MTKRWVPAEIGGMLDTLASYQGVPTFTIAEAAQALAKEAGLTIGPPPAAPGGQIYGALIEVMREVMAVGKGGEYRERPDGPVQYKFRGVDAVINAAGPAFRKVGVVPVPTILSTERTPGTTKHGGSKMTTVLRVRYRFYAADGSYVDAEVEGEANDMSDKGTGKAFSVAYRIAFLQVLAIPTDDPDPDAVRIEGDHTPPVSQALAVYIRNGVETGPLASLRDLYELLCAHVAADVRVNPDEPASPVWWELWALRYRAEVGARTTKDELAALWKEIGPFGTNFRIGKGETVGSLIVDAGTIWQERNRAARQEAIEAIDAAGSGEQLDEVVEVIKSQLGGKTLLAADTQALLERVGNRRTVLEARQANEAKHISTWGPSGTPDDGEDTTQADTNKEQL